MTMNMVRAKNEKIEKNILADMRNKSFKVLASSASMQDKIEREKRKFMKW